MPPVVDGFLSQLTAGRQRARLPRRRCVSSIARVIGPTPPGIGAMWPATSKTSRRDVADESCLGARCADVQHGRAGLDHVGGDETGHAGSGDDDVGAADVAGQVAVPVWHRVTVAFSVRRVSSSPSGRPTVTPRPTTQTSAPSRSTSYARSSSTMPRGVHGSGASAMSTSRPRFIGCSPSASLSGSTSSSARWRRGAWAAGAGR